MTNFPREREARLKRIARGLDGAMYQESLPNWPDQKDITLRSRFRAMVRLILRRLFGERHG